MVVIHGVHAMTNERLTYESGIVGAIIVFGELLPDVADKISIDYFQDISIASIYSAAIDVMRSGTPVDPVTISDQMRKTGTFNQQIEKLIVDLMGLAPPKSSIQLYVGKLKEIHELNVMRKSIATAMDECVDTKSLADAIMSSITDIERGNKENTAYELCECVDEFIEWARGERGDPIMTGHIDLDRIFGGARPGKLICIAARPGIGKSALSAEIAIRMSLSGIKPAMFSLEMQRVEIMQRFVSMQSGVDLANISDRKFANGGDGAKLVANSLMRMKKLQMLIDQNPAVTTFDIRRALQRDKEIGAVFVDYLQLMKSYKEAGNRNLEIGDITRELKIIAMEFGIPIFMASQLNRNKDETAEPSLTDLRDSGNIEQDVDTAILLWLLEHANEDELRKLGVKVAKNRQGKTGICVMYFDGAHMTFKDSDEEYIPNGKSYGRNFYPINGHDPSFPFN